MKLRSPGESARLAGPQRQWTLWWGNGWKSFTDVMCSMVPMWFPPLCCLYITLESSKYMMTQKQWWVLGCGRPFHCLSRSNHSVLWFHSFVDLGFYYYLHSSWNKTSSQIGNCLNNETGFSKHKHSNQCTPSKLWSWETEALSVMTILLNCIQIINI